MIAVKLDIVGPLENLSSHTNVREAAGLSSFYRCTITIIFILQWTFCSLSYRIHKVLYQYHRKMWYPKTVDIGIILHQNPLRCTNINIGCRVSLKVYMPNPFHTNSKLKPKMIICIWHGEHEITNLPCRGRNILLQPYRQSRFQRHGADQAEKLSPSPAIRDASVCLVPFAVSWDSSPIPLVNSFASFPTVWTNPKNLSFCAGIFFLPMTISLVFFPPFSGLRIYKSDSVKLLLNGQNENINGSCQTISKILPRIPQACHNNRCVTSWTRTGSLKKSSLNKFLLLSNVKNFIKASRGFEM